MDPKPLRAPASGWFFADFLAARVVLAPLRAGAIGFRGYLGDTVPRPVGAARSFPRRANARRTIVGKGGAMKASSVLCAALLMACAAAPGAASSAAGDPPEFAVQLKAATSGDAQAQFEVARAYAAGTGVPKDSAKAVEWYRRAADQGHVWAQDALGDAYADGD